MKTHEFDRAFDDGEDVSAHVDWAGRAASISGQGGSPTGVTLFLKLARMLR